MPDANGRTQGDIGWDPTTDPDMLAWLAGIEAWKQQTRAHSAELDAQWRAEAKARSRKARSRIPRSELGERQAGTGGPAKITEGDVRSIRRRHAAGENRNHLAQEFGITPRQINLITSRRRWANVSD